MPVDFEAAFRQPEPEPPSGLPALFDTEGAKRQLAQYDEGISQMVAEATALVVVDDPTNTRAVELAGGSKRLNKALEEARKHFVGPANDYVKRVNGLFKPYQDRLAGVEAGLKRKVGDYQWQVEMERRKREAEAQEAARKLQVAMDKEAKKLKIEAPQIPLPVEPAKAAVTRTELGSAHQRMEWRFELVAVDQLPREYLVPDLGRIRQAVKNGLREIPGCRIYEEPVTVLRS